MPTRERETAESAAEESLRTETQRIDDRRVRAEVTAVEEDDAGRVRVTARLPDGRTVTETMDRPAPWSTAYKFARIVESAGYGPGSLHYLVGDRVPLERTDDGWRFVDPDRIRFWAQRNRRRLTAAGVVPLVGAAAALVVGFAPVEAALVAALLILLLPGLYLLSIPLRGLTDSL